MKPFSYKLGGLCGLSLVGNLLKQLTELRKALYLQLKFYCNKRTPIRTSQRKTHTGQKLRPGTPDLHIFSVLSDGRPTPAAGVWQYAWSMASPGSSPSFRAPSICWGFIMQAWFVEPSTLWLRGPQSIGPLPSLKGLLLSGGSKPQPSNHKPGLSHSQSPSWVTFLAQTIQRPTVNNKYVAVTQKILRFRGSLSAEMELGQRLYPKFSLGKVHSSPHRYVSAAGGL